MMPSEMVPAQQVSELSDEMVRLLAIADAEIAEHKLRAAAKDAQIAALTEQRDHAERTAEDRAEQSAYWQREAAEATEQRDRAMKVVEAARAWAVDRHAALTSAFYPSETSLFNAVVGFNSLDAGAAAETAPSLPETP